jgi:hypothetical protein
MQYAYSFCESYKEVQGECHSANALHTVVHGPAFLRPTWRCSGHAGDLGGPQTLRQEVRETVDKIEKIDLSRALWIIKNF